MKVAFPPAPEPSEAAAEAGGLPRSGPQREEARQYVLDTMGQSKITVFRALFDDEDTAQRANAAFEESYASLIDAGHRLVNPIAPPRDR